MIYGMSLVRNEAGKNRWLDKFLTQMTDICDKVIILDDDSKDLTQDICNDYGCKIYFSEKSLWGIDEREQRQRLWNETTKRAKEDDWILCLDADELFIPEHIPYLKYLLNSLNRFDVDGIAFRLYDMWTNKHYREDLWWTAHLRAWTFMVKYKNMNYKWLDKKLHCGRFPVNSSSKCIQSWIPVKHMGWSLQEFREKKYKRYMEVDPEGKEGNLEQYKSILDRNPNLIKF